MKIASAAIELGASHDKQQSHQLQESLRIERGRDRAASPTRPAIPSVQISDAGQAAQSTEANAIENGIDAAENDPMLNLIRFVVAMLTGQDVKVFDRRALASDTSASAPQSQGSALQNSPVTSGLSIEYQRHETYSENEQTSFSANGSVTTADGKEINFSLSLDMTRSYHEESSVSIRIGDARQKKDPLVINFAGNAAQLSSQKFRFDLDADGQSEEINFVASGSGFLVFDRNGDGKINNGSELFGATSGDGFAELSALDSDHNGWIDENDAAYSQLQVWTKNGAGDNQLSTLKQAGVGAISLSKVATPFDLKDASNTLLGQIRTTGIYLQENGKASTLQQIDLMV